MVWGLSTRNTFTPWTIQKRTTSSSSVHRPASQASRSRAGRCPRSAWAGSPRSGCEPSGRCRNQSGMLGHPRMVGRRLEGHIDGHFDTPRRGGGHEVAESPRACRAPDGSHVCPPSTAPMAQGLPGSPLGRVGRTVASLAARPSDGMDRRQVEDVEPHVGHVGQLRPHVGERAVARRLRGGRAREHLVPRAEARLLPVGGHREDLGGHRPLRVTPPVHEMGQLVGEDELAQGGDPRPGGDLFGDFAGQTLDARPEVRRDEGEHAMVGHVGPLRARRRPTRPRRAARPQCLGPPLSWPAGRGARSGTDRPWLR